MARDCEYWNASGVLIVHAAIAFAAVISDEIVRIPLYLDCTLADVIHGTNVAHRLRTR
jgi:hypothetical protein